MNTVAIIPARFASSRFPGKPFAMIAGVPMIIRVIERVRPIFPRVIVATDHGGIADLATASGAEAVITPSDLPNGTARCLAAALRLSPKPDMIVNIQGDEPLVDPDDLTKLISVMNDPDIDIATIAHRFPGTLPFPDLADPARVKVTVDRRGNALYFSRSVIPDIRGVDPSLWPARFSYLIHAGIYAYRLSTLQQLVDLPPSPLSEAESLEQLRWLENGYRIHVAVTDGISVGVDTPDDIQKVENLLK